MRQNKYFPGIGQAVGLIIAVFLLQIAFAIPLSIGVSIQDHPIILAFASLGSFGLVLLWGIQKNQKSAAEILPLIPVRGALLLPIILSMLGLGILLSELDNLVRFALPPPQWLLDMAKNLTEPKTIPWEPFIALVVVAPLTEELFFRGLILRGFLSRYSAVVSVLVSALLFGLLHGNPWQFFSATVLGIVFAWWFLRTRSLLPCLMGHSCNNAIVLFSSLLPFQIRGFNLVESFSPIQFQPPWFDLTGLILLGLGLWLFQQLTPRLVSSPSSVVSSR